MGDTYDAPEDFNVRGPYRANTDPQKSAQPCGCDEGAGYTSPTCAEHNRLYVGEEPATQVQPTYRYIPPRKIKPERVDIETQAPTRCTTLPTDPAERKKYPIATGFMDYFPDAIAAVAHVSWVGNNQHNPGQPLHWARGKSMDQDDTKLRHMLERGGGNVSGFDVDGVLHRAKEAWRTMAALQLEIEDLVARGLYPPKENK